MAVTATSLTGTAGDPGRQKPDGPPAKGPETGPDTPEAPATAGLPGTTRPEPGAGIVIDSPDRRIQWTLDEWGGRSLDELFVDCGLSPKARSLLDHWGGLYGSGPDAVPEDLNNAPPL